MARVTLPLFLLALVSNLSAADECADCKKSELCLTHAVEDKAAMDAYVKAATSKDPKARLASLEAYAAVCRKHLNCRRPTSANFVGGGLKDPDHDVRMRTIELLQETQDQRISAMLAGPVAKALRQKLEKRPKTDAEKARWQLDFKFYEALAKFLNGTGLEEASPAIADLLEAIQLDLLEVAAANCSNIHTSAVALAVGKAMWRVKPGTDEKSKSLYKTLSDARDVIAQARGK